MPTYTISNTIPADFVSPQAFMAGALAGDTGVMIASDLYDLGCVEPAGKANITLTNSPGTTPTIKSWAWSCIWLTTGDGGFALAGADDASRIRLWHCGNIPGVRIAASNVGALTFEFVDFESPATQIGIQDTSAGGQSGTITITRCGTIGMLFSLVYGVAFADLRCDYNTGSFYNEFIRVNSFGGYIRRSIISASGLIGSIAASLTTTGSPIIAGNRIYQGEGINATRKLGIIHLDSNDVNVTIVGNTIYHDGTTQVGIYWSSGCTALVVRDNIVQHADYAYYGGTAITTDHNCGFGSNTANWGGLATKGAGDIETDPRFLAVVTGDLRIDTTSPCWETGVGTGETPDAYGTTRPQGSAYDMGYFEVPGSPGPSPVTVSTARAFDLRWSGWDLAGGLMPEVTG